MDRLKPCPFCGTKAEMIRRPLWEGSHGYQGCYNFKVTCGKCGCTLNYAYADTIYRTEEEAINNVINAWNERKNETAITPQPKTGNWILDDSDDSMTCDKCECTVYAIDMVDGELHYCPNCGDKKEGIAWID